jgi:hypothetical protein
LHAPHLIWWCFIATRKATNGNAKVLHVACSISIWLILLLQKRKRVYADAVRSSPNRWTEEEDIHLLRLVKRHGLKQWKLIASKLGTSKTSAQCAQHWKRWQCGFVVCEWPHFRVMSPEIRKGPWTCEEEELLLEYAPKCNFRWAAVQQRIPNRTDTQCRYQFCKYQQLSKVSSCCQ